MSNIMSELGDVASASENPESSDPSESQTSEGRIIDYREELIMYFCDQMLPYIVSFWEVLDVKQLKEKESKDSLFDGKPPAMSMVTTCRNTFRLKSTSRMKSIQSSKILSEYKADASYFNSVASVYGSSSKYLNISMGSREVDSDPFEWLIQKTEEYAYVVFRNGNEYVGPIVNKLMHGKGIFVWDEGAYYDGDFVNGCMTGEGVLKYPECSYYHGQFCDGMLHGMGSFYPLTTSMVYNGEWRYGKKHGKGWMLYDTGNFYDGEWANDFKEGVGYRQYENGTVYKGCWKNGLPDGKGMIQFPNGDFYNGDWRKGVPHGYGVYTWKSGMIRGLTLTIENKYEGSWFGGKREGVGVLYFGMDGSKLKSKFRGNQKHGAGQLTCGNGTIIKKNPLFVYDKLSQQSGSTQIGHRMTVQVMSSRHSVPRIMRSMQSVTARYDSIMAVRQSGSNMATPTLTKCQPLPVPIHATAANVDVEEHITKLILEYMFAKDDPASFGQNRSTFQLSLVSGLNINIDHREYVHISYDYEELKLRNAIMHHYQVLQNLYTTYASLTYTGRSIKPVLSRLLLWQMARDLNFDKTGLSLVQIDHLLYTYPDSAIETKHSPFEPIQFWQFIHLVLLICWQYYCDVVYFERHRSDGIYARMLKDFVVDFVVPNFGTFKGEALFKYKDLMPIKGVYKLYRSVGEPHTARTFLRRCCVRKQEQPMCHLISSTEGNNDVILSGTNAIFGGGHFVYLPDESCDILDKKREICECPFERDAFYKDLKVFRSLGPKRILACLCQICPLIKNDKFISNMSYKLTFLEFHEVVLLLALEYIADRKKEQEKLLKKAARLSAKSVNSSRSASISSKRKSKVKKSV